MIVWPTDIDIFMEVNNGRYLSLMDIGRFDYGAKIGLTSVLKRRKWGLAVAGSSVRYRKRMHLFEKFNLHTKVVAVDEKWTYFHQVIKRRGQWCAATLARTAVTNAQGIVPSAEVAKELGFEWEHRMPDWVKRWDEADQMRPWGDT